jgi:hypothetical protein
MKQEETTTTQPAFRPLVDAARDHGICKGVAFRLAKEGLLDTFKIGARRYVRMESFSALSDRLRSEV